MSAGTSKETLRKTATLVKSHLKVSKAKLQSKIKSVDGLEKILPRSYRKPAAGEQLILENHSVLYLSYLCVVTIAAGVFIGQLLYYGDLKETVTDITDDSSLSNGYDSCKALQVDSTYGLKWTYETCKEKEANGDGSYAKFSNASSIMEYGYWYGSHGYMYFPFTTSSSSQGFLIDECDEGKSLLSTIGNPQWTILSLSATFNKEASCSGSSVQYVDGTRCAVRFSTTNGDGGAQDSNNRDYTYVQPKYVLLPLANTAGVSWYQNVITHDGVTFAMGSAGYVPSEERCLAYEKECATQAFKHVISISEECHPCNAFKDNSPFLCKKSKYKTTLEILSLSVSNTLAVFSFLVALAPMILSSFANRLSTKGVSKEEGDDDGEDDEDDSV